MKKLTILHIANVRFFNATAWYAMQLSKKLCEIGHNSIVMTLEGTKADKAALEMDIPRIALPFDQKKISNFPAIFSFLKKTIEETKPDIVNCHRGELFPLFIYFKKKYGFKLVRTRGDQRLAKNTFLNRYFYAKISDAVIATNSRISKHLHEELQVPKEKLFTILGGVDIRKFYPNPAKKNETKKQYGYSKNDCVIGLLGRLDPIKGQKESIIALAKASERMDNLKLCIIGFDEIHTSEELYALASEYGVRDKVQITGKVKEINDVLNMCDIALLSSVGSEAIARAAVEFIACNIPLISSNIGVMPDLVSQKGRFETGNIEDMAQMLIRASKAHTYTQDANHKNYAIYYAWLQDILSEQKNLLPSLTLDNFTALTLEVYNK